MLEGGIPKAPTAPAPTELELHLPKTCQPVSFGMAVLHGEQPNGREYKIKIPGTWEIQILIPILPYLHSSRVLPVSSAPLEKWPEP